MELAFYLASSLDETRKLLATFRSLRTQGLILWLTAILPYLIFSLAAGTFQSHAFYLLVALTGVFSLWNVVLPRRPAYDVGFFAIAAAPILTRAFGRIYISPAAHPQVDFLGKLMWIRIGLMALLVLREWDPGAFGLWPNWLEWRLGALYYCAAIVPIALLALSIHDVHWSPLTGEWWKVGGIALGTFFGYFWVTAFSEELFFRGVLTRALLDHLSSRPFAIVLSSIVFGGAHLWFHVFPDWRQALVAGVLGLFLAHAYARSGSVRVPMVAHTLVITTWRLFFRLGS